VLEGSVDNVGVLIVEEWHDWLVLRSIPRHVSWSSESVPVADSVVLMVDWLLPQSPLLVGSGYWSSSWNDSSQVKPEQVWIVQQRPEGESVVVEHDWSEVGKTSASSISDEEEKVGVHDGRSSVETLNWKLSDQSHSHKDSQGSSGGVASVVPVRKSAWSVQQVLNSVLLGVPRGNNIEVLLGLVGPVWSPLLDIVR